MQAHSTVRQGARQSWHGHLPAVRARVQAEPNHSEGASIGGKKGLSSQLLLILRNFRLSRRSKGRKVLCTGRIAASWCARSLAGVTCFTSRLFDSFTFRAATQLQQTRLVMDQKEGARFGRKCQRGGKRSSEPGRRARATCERASSRCLPPPAGIPIPRTAATRRSRWRCRGERLRRRGARTKQRHLVTEVDPALPASPFPTGYACDRCTLDREAAIPRGGVVATPGGRPCPQARLQRSHRSTEHRLVNSRPSRSQSRAALHCRVASRSFALRITTCPG